MLSNNNTGTNTNGSSSSQKGKRDFDAFNGTHPLSTPEIPQKKLKYSRYDGSDNSFSDDSSSDSDESLKSCSDQDSSTTNPSKITDEKPKTNTSDYANDDNDEADIKPQTSQNYNSSSTESSSSPHKAKNIQPNYTSEFDTKSDSDTDESSNDKGSRSCNDQHSYTTNPTQIVDKKREIGNNNCGADDNDDIDTKQQPVQNHNSTNVTSSSSSTSAKDIHSYHTFEEHKASLNKQLHDAIKVWNLTKMESCLANGAEIDYLDDNGLSPAHYILVLAASAETETSSEKKPLKAFDMLALSHELSKVEKSNFFYTLFYYRIDFYLCTGKDNYITGSYYPANSNLFHLIAITDNINVCKFLLKKIPPDDIISLLNQKNAEQLTPEETASECGNMRIIAIIKEFRSTLPPPSTETTSPTPSMQLANLTCSNNTNYHSASNHFCGDNKEITTSSSSPSGNISDLDEYDDEKPTTTSSAAGDTKFTASLSQQTFIQQATQQQSSAQNNEQVPTFKNNT